jgi:hypothetical protein
MNERLHPLTLGEVLDRTAQLYRSRFLVYAGIAIIPAGAVLLFVGVIFGFLAWAGVTSATGISQASMGALVVLVLVAVGLVAAPVCFGVMALGWAAMTHAATRAFLGEPITIREAYKSAWSHLWRYVGLGALMVLILGVAPIGVLIGMTALVAALGALVRSAGMGATAGALVGGATLLLFVGVAAYMLWMLLRICMAYPACVMEQIGAWSAIKRAQVLSRGTKGRIFVLFLLGVALSWILAMGLMIPMVIVIALIPGVAGAQHSQTLSVVMAIMWYLLSFAVQVLTRPIYGIALAVFYFDQRIRTEGFDIEWMMRESGMAQESAAVQSQAEPWLPRGVPDVAITSMLPKANATNARPTGSLDPESPKAGGLA